MVHSPDAHNSQGWPGPSKEPGALARSAAWVQEPKHGLPGVGLGPRELAPCCEWQCCSRQALELRTVQPGVVCWAPLVRGSAIMAHGPRGVAGARPRQPGSCGSPSSAVLCVCLLFSQKVCNGSFISGKQEDEWNVGGGHAEAIVGDGVAETVVLARAALCLSG